MNRGPIWFGIALVVIVAAVGGWIYFSASRQNLNVGVTLAADSSNVLLGDEFTISVTLANDSGFTLKNAAIALALPSNIISIDAPNQRVVAQTLGNVDAGGMSHEDFRLIATGGGSGGNGSGGGGSGAGLADNAAGTAANGTAANTVAHFTARVTYGAGGSSAQFENDGNLDVAIGSPAVGVNIAAPMQVFSGQNFSITVSYHNNSGHAIRGVSLAMQYPPAFGFTSASSSLGAGGGPNGNSSWDLGAIPPNGNGTIAITGSLVGPPGAAYPIAAILSNIGSGQSAAAQNSGVQNYIIANPIANVAIADSPLIFGITINNSQNYISAPADFLDYVLTFKNNSAVTFENMTVAANLAGKMFDFSTLQSGGSFNSVANTITWNGGSAPQLLSLAPGQSGSVEFRIRTKSAFPIRLLSDKNYSLTVRARLQSPTVPAGTAASATISVANMTTKLRGNIVLLAKGYRYDPSGIVNSGPYPPRVNKPTEYSVHWLITNYATDAANVTISAYLQSGTTCTGKTRLSGISAASTTVGATPAFLCNPANGEVTWNIPTIAATTGISGRPLEAIFQVMNTPSVNQVGQTITLVDPATLAADDAFTSSTMQSSAPAITTALPDDTGITTYHRQVVP